MDIYPILPKADRALGRKAYAAVRDVPILIDLAVLAIPAKFVAKPPIECRETRYQARSLFRIIVMNREDLKDGRTLMDPAHKVSQKKPLVALKGGCTSAGPKAASSRTGALARNDKIYDDIVRQAGLILAKDLRN